MMEILNNTSSLLQNVDVKNITTPLITAVLLNFEDCSKALEQENRPTPFVQVAENLAKLFNGYLLTPIEPTQNDLNFIRGIINIIKKLHFVI